MLLIALLLFCRVIDDIDLNNLHNKDAELHTKIMDDLLTAEESLKQGKIFDTNAENLPAPDDESSGTLPALVPFEFPADFYEKQGRKIIEAVETKMGKFFGAEQTNKLKTFDNAEGMYEYLANMDFNNPIVNFIVQQCITYMKPTEKLPIEGITDRKSCKNACRHNLSASIAFVHRIFQSFISQVTDEDLRFRIYQNPKKCYKYSFDEPTDKHECKCVDEGYQVKVSPRLLEIINDRFINSKDTDLAELLEKETPTEDLSNAGTFHNLRKLGNLALYFAGFSSNAKSRNYPYYGGCNNYYPKQDVGKFITTHFIINIFLFIFCHCLWYFHIVYFVLVFFTEYVL